MRALRRDHDDAELLGRRARTTPGVSPPPPRRLLAHEVGRHRHAVDRLRREHEERDRVDRHQRARREHRPLHALLAAAVDELAQVREVAELGLVDAALRADRQRRADLRDHDADLARRHLHPRVLLHREDRPELDAQARHQQRRPGSRPRRGRRSGCPRASLRTAKRLLTSPTSVGPMRWIDFATTNTRNTATTMTTIKSAICAPLFCSSGRPSEGIPAVFGPSFQDNSRARAVVPCDVSPRVPSGCTRRPAGSASRSACP